MPLTTQVVRWGASLAVRIPKPVAEHWGVREGVVVDLVPGRNQVILRKKRYELKALVAGITPTNRHGETDWGEAKGAEAW